MSSHKKLLTLPLLALLVGAGIAGGVYVVSTPTSTVPRAVSPGTFSAIPTRSPRFVELVATPTPMIISEESIVRAFGSSNASFDLNHDGIVNTLDLLEFRKSR